MFIPKTYTVESVTSGHPDKVCDLISDAILDVCLEQDPFSKVAVECFGSHGLLVIGGEVTTKAEVDYEKVARETYEKIGYDASNLKTISHIVEQSPEIAQGIGNEGAGDQGIMYGFATNETPGFLPLGVVLSHKFAKNLHNLRTSGELPWLLPDGKTQVTIQNNAVQTVLVSTQHSTDISLEDLKQELVRKLIAPTLQKVKTTDDVKFVINPAGEWHIGGFEADAGLTGRKIMVDTYGGLVPHGGGCFSGKDATKVDRSGAYMARFVAREIVKRGDAKECLVSVAYAIGLAEPVMLTAVDESGNDISDLVKRYDFRPQAIIERLNLRAPIFQQTTNYGHFGKSNLPW